MGGWGGGAKRDFGRIGTEEAAISNLGRIGDVDLPSDTEMRGPSVNKVHPNQENGKEAVAP